MALRTAPCPTCGNTLVFGERRCRGCGMTFDYGANGPAEPTPAEIFDTLAGSSSAPPAGAPAPVAPSRPRDDVPGLPDIDTGRFSVGEVQTDDVPGLIDSTLFKSMTPDHVDVDLVAGLETTRQAGGDVEVFVSRIPGMEGRADEIGDVVTTPVPGLFGSDLFKADVDIGAGAAAAGDMLDVTPNAGRIRKKSADGAGQRIVCPSCSTVHFLTRCPICGTAVPSRD